MLLSSLSTLFVSHLHNGPVHAGSQRALLYSPPLCGTWSQPLLHRPPNALWCAHSVQSAHIWLVLFLEGPERDMREMAY